MPHVFMALDPETKRVLMQTREIGDEDLRAASAGWAGHSVKPTSRTHGGRPFSLAS